MQEGNGSFHLKPEWVEIANDKDVDRMAGALYFDLKQHKHNGAMIHPSQVEEMIHLVQKVLYTDYDWNEEEVSNLGKKFIELNKYSPTEMEESQLSPVIKAIMPELIKSAALAPSIMGPGHGTGSIHMEFVRHKPKKFSKWIFAKNIVVSTFKIVVYWLALLGLLMLLGL